MSECFSKINDKILNFISQQNEKCDSDAITSDVDPDDILLSLYSKNCHRKEHAINTDFSQSTNNSEKRYLKQIQTHIAKLTHSQAWNDINLEIHEILTENLSKPLIDYFGETIKEIESLVQLQKKLKESFTYNTIHCSDIEQSIFSYQSKPTAVNEADQQLDIVKYRQEKAKIRMQQVSGFAIQSLTTILRLLIQSATNYDSTLVHEILMFGSQLCEQMPLNCLSSSIFPMTHSSYLLRALKPLTNYFSDLCQSNDPLIAKQALQILLSLAFAKGSFKEILAILSKLMFNITDVYPVTCLLTQLNDEFQDILYERKAIKHSIGLEYLESLGVYPTSKLMNMETNQLTGQLIASVILAHIDLNNEINSAEQFESGSINSSLSFDFHPETFKLLFQMIERLNTENNRNTAVSFMLITCVRLFVTHLKYFSALKSNVNRDLFSTTDLWSKSSLWNRFQSSNNIDLTQLPAETETKQWLKLFSDIVFNDDDPSKSLTLKTEASNGLIYLVDITTSSFTDKLSFINEHLFKKENPSSIESFWFELNRNVTLLCWIEALCNEQNVTLPILHSLIDRYSNSPNNQLKIKQFLLSFQKLLLTRFLLQSCQFENVSFLQSQIETTSTNSTGLSSLMVEYITRILSEHRKKKEDFDDLLYPILLTICYVVSTLQKVNFSLVWPVIMAALPFIADAILHNENNDTNLHSLSWLLSRMNLFLIVGSVRSSLEDKHADQLTSILFTNGFEQNEQPKHLFESNLTIQSKVTFDEYRGDSLLDNEFLMSIYANTGRGAQLVDKMRFYIKQKHGSLQKTSESLANEACTALFAVYIKHYRCIELAKAELPLEENLKVHNKLLSLFEYANQVYTIFAKVKGQGADCQKLCDQIKTNSLFLLLNVKESHSVPAVHVDKASDLTTTDNIQLTKRPRLMRQNSGWTRAKHVFQVLRSTLRVCILLKKLIKSKNNTSEKRDYEKLLRQCIDNFIFGNINKASTSTSNEEKKSIIEDFHHCISQQYERAIMRLITYRFSESFLRKLLTTQDQKRIRTIVSVCLPHLRHVNLQWSHQTNIETANKRLKQEIANSYYTCVKLVLDYLLQLDHREQIFLAIPMFNLLNTSYQPIDIDLSHHYHFAETIFRSFISLMKQTDNPINMKLRFIAFNWFRMFVLRLCENIQIDHINDSKTLSLQEEGEFIFNQLIFNELKHFRQKYETIVENEDNANSTIEPNDSLHQVTFRWFLGKDNDSSIVSSKSDIELHLNQWIILLLRCFHTYPQVQAICTTIEYIKEFQSIHQRSQRVSSSLLALKVLRYLVSFSSETTSGVSSAWIRTVLMEIFSSIEVKELNSNITCQKINFYRTIMSLKSAWQTMATQILVNSMTLNFDENQSNNFIASLCILGGYIQPFGLGSIVNAYVEQDNINDYSLALIIENKNDEGSHFVQYSKQIKPEWTTIDNLRVEIDVPPPNLFSLPQSDDLVQVVLDKLGSFIQIRKAQRESVALLQLKRRCICALSHLLNDRKLIEVFMQKSYASVLTELAIRSLPLEHRSALVGLREFQKDHLEQYCLRLNNCEHAQVADEKNKTTAGDNNATTDNKDTSLFSVWNKNPMTPDAKIVDALCSNVSISGGWKANAFEAEIEFFKQERLGQDEVIIVPVPANAVDASVIEECGDKHRFLGRINMNKDTKNCPFPTFKIQNLKVNQGKWYFCVKLPQAGLVQIGWATDGFRPHPYNGHGVGDDFNSWSYDGSRSTLFHVANSTRYPKDEIFWSVNDVCGCGISIDDEGTQIGYWLNGKFLGTAFAERSYLGPSAVKCNMKPNGTNTTYFPSISLESSQSDKRCCELIVSPEDMTNCPLPDGYKPLLLPKLVNTENSIVRYPCNAYLIGDTVENYFQTSRQNKSTTRLRDFINECHLETSFSTDDKYLLLSETSNGLPFPIDNLSSPLTISFDFKLLGLEDEHDNKNIRLFTLGDFSAEIPKLNEEVRIAIVFCPKEQQTKVYMNEKCRIFYEPITFDNTVKLTMNILPNINAGIRNLATWKYALADQDISRLFTYGLFYVGADYQRVREYRKQTNVFTFIENQQTYADELLVPFKEPFEESLWKIRKQKADHDESIYFKSIDGTGQSVLQFFGSKTYLALDIASTDYSEFTLILDVLIPNYPNANEQITLVTLSPQLSIGIIDDRCVCLSSNNEIVTIGTVNFVRNKYVRMVVSVNNGNCNVYTNGSLTFSEEKQATKVNPIFLFREESSTKNSIGDDMVRVQCKLIGLLNRVVPMIHFMSSTKVSLDALFKLPVSLMMPSLSGMGHKLKWIESVVKSSTAMNIQTVDNLLRERKQELIDSDLESQHESYMKVLLALSPLIDQDKFKNFIGSLKLTNHDDLSTTAELMLKYWSNITDEKNDNKKKWLLQTICDTSNPANIIAWLRKRGNSNEEKESINIHFDSDENSIQESDLTITTSQNLCKRMKNSIQYSHRDMSLKQYQAARIACEHGLISIYAREVVFNLLRVWSNNGGSLFPLQSLVDYESIFTLLKLMNFHYTSTRDQMDVNIDTINKIVETIIRTELTTLQKHIKTTGQLADNVFQTLAPFLSRLQRDVVGQAVLLLADPSLLSDNPYENVIFIDEQELTRKPQLTFLLEMVSTQAELISDKSVLNQHEIDLIISHAFPELLINILFDLFLLNPVYQTEISILRILATLIQASEKVQFNESIAGFFTHLVNALSKIDRSAKSFKIAVIDLFYVMWNRMKNKILNDNSNDDKVYSTLTKCSEDVKDLLLLIDSIDVFIDETKLKSLSESFITRARAVSRAEFNFTLQDFESSHSHFNIITDQEARRFMNDSLLTVQSFNEFIKTLPTESEPNPTFYKNYAILSKISASAIKARCTSFVLLNMLFNHVKPFVYLCCPPGQSIVADKLRKSKIYLSYRRKLKLLLESTGIFSSRFVQTINIEFDTCKAALSNENEENTMFYQAFRQLHKQAHNIFRSTGENLWHATYRGMHATDAGGVFRDSITLICADICSTRLSLFILCPNGRTNSGLNRDRWIPNVFSPNESIPSTYRDQYKFIGQLMGMAIWKKYYLDLKFPTLLWKQLVNEPVTVEDIEAIDLQSFKVIEEVERNFSQNEFIDKEINVGYLFSSIMSELRFSVVGSAGHTYELIPDGNKIPVTVANFKDYCRKYRDYRLNEFRRQIEFIAQGLYSIVPFHYLSLFTPNEIEEAVCGKGHIDVELLKRNTTYEHPNNAELPHIQRFWTVLSEIFNEEQKKSFIAFVWGRNTLPRCDEDFTTKFTINSYDSSSENIDRLLPRSHTCSFALDLPEYSTTEIMYERLNYAITYCSHIDGD